MQSQITLILLQSEGSTRANDRIVESSSSNRSSGSYCQTELYDASTSTNSQHSRWKREPPIKRQSADGVHLQAPDIERDGSLRLNARCGTLYLHRSNAYICRQRRTFKRAENRILTVLKEELQRLRNNSG